jgi:hypothetical protein
MARRTPETLADYLVVAVCPTLIGLLVGSLMFFLVEVFYPYLEGDYKLRMLWVMAMFVLAIVGIARISMEEGMAYASLFAFPLALSVGVALARFVPASPLLSWLLMGIVWWATHKLTWDCTLVDETQDASGQGLLQQMGLEPSGQGGVDDTTRGAIAAPEGTTSTSAPAKSWWEKLLEPDRRPHAPGVWVVYFSLAALPTFGIGGWYVSGNDPDLRRRVFRLLVVYVACGTALLLATSFLGLRRYLRQRRLSMPLEMTATWITAGAVMIVAMLVLAAVLPRPRAEHSISQLPGALASAALKASRYAVGPEGTEDSSQKGEVATTEAREGQKSKRQGAAGSEKSTGEKGETSEQGENEGSKQAGGKSGDAASKDQGGNKQSQDGKPDGKQGGKSNEKSSSSEGSKQQSESNDQVARRDASQEQQSAEQSQEPGTETRAQESITKPLSNLASQLSQSLGTVLRWLFYAALLLAGLVYAWIYRQELLAAWRKLLEELRELWAGWFGGRPSAEEAAPMVSVPVPRPFAAYADPFLTGAAARMSGADLIRYTFEATQAWARERECPRQPEQTPLEFAATIETAEPGFGGSIRSLAGWYSQLAYAPKSEWRGSRETIRQIWSGLGESSGVVGVL